MIFRVVATVVLYLVIYTPSFSQTSCPPNIDFEDGNYGYWKFYTGSCCPINTPTLSGAVNNRHVLTSGASVDPFGGFPVVAPGGGNYSIKLGNTATGAQAERARYYVHVPAGVNNYSLVYKYAVVFQDPSHTPSQQPRFEVKAFDSSTNTQIPCANFSYVASSNLPGFSLSTAGYQIWYKPWTTASLNLSGYAGKTVIVEFSTGDCLQGAHFGYGYLDLSCSLFEVVSVNCQGAPTTTLNAPPGFQTYTWWNYNFSAIVATGQNVSISTPPTSTQYHVILSPFSGYGCLDTLTTTVNVASLALTGSPDTTVCTGGSVQLNTGAVSNSAMINYSWTPSVGLDCSNCASPVASPSQSTSYVVTVSDGNGCTLQDTITVSVSEVSTTMAGLAASCFGSSDGSATVTPAGGTTPYTYSWSTNPIQTTATASGLSAGTYSVVVTDANGCSESASITITQPTVLNALILNSAHASCFGASNGSATATATGGVTPYTFSWNTNPVQTTAMASGLSAGTYTVTVTDANGCTSTQAVTTTEPTAVETSISGATSVTCFGGADASATAVTLGGTAPYTYSWNTIPAQAGSTASGLSAGNYVVTVTDANGCSDTAVVTIMEPAVLTATTNVFNPLCLGGNSGSVTAVPTGGTSPYSYLWNTTPVQTSPTAANLVAGTYNVTITDGNGCTVNASASITGPATPLSASVIASSNVLCNGGNNGSASVAATGGAAPYTYAWNTTPAQTSSTAINLTAGTYTATVTDNNGCTTNATVVITEPAPALSVSISANSMLSCFGDANGTATANVAGGVAPYTYFWNTNPVQSNATASGLSAGMYAVTVTDVNGCTATQSVTLTEPTQLMASISGNTAVNCFGGNDGSAAAVAVGGTGSFAYSWNTTPVQTSATATNLSAGIYIVTISDANGCSDTAQVAVAQPAALTVATGVANLNCLGSNNGTATAIVGGGTLPFTYAWNTTPVQTTNTATGLSTGNYSVTVTDANGCSGTASATILPPSTPVSAVITSSTPVACSGSATGSATAAASAGTPPYTYFWNTVPAQNTATANNLAAGTYMVTVSDANGCGDTASVTVPGPAAPLALVVSNVSDVTCFGGTDGTAAVATSGGTAPYSYSWNTTPVQTNATASGLSAGTYTVTITDANGCTATQSVTLTEPVQLVASVSGSADVSCFGGFDGSVTALATGGTGAYTYSWNTIPVQTSASASNLSNGVYTVTVTDGNGCSDVETVSISQPAALTVATGVANLNCLGSNSGTATAMVGGGTSPYTYVWNTSPVQTTATATGLSTGSYSVSVMDANGCTGTANATILPPSTPVNVAVTTSTPVACSGSATGSATAVASAGTPPYTYFWNTVPAQNTATANNLAVGTYMVTVSDANGCGDTASVTISAPASPLALIVSNVSDVSCFGATDGSATLTPSGGTAPYNYSWNTIPGQTTATASGLGAGSYMVTVTDANGCIATQSVNIAEPANLNIALASTAVTCNGGADGSATAVVTGGVTPYIYNWSSIPSQTGASVSNLNAGSYQLIITDGNGCTASASTQVNEPAPLISTMAVTNLFCTGGNSGSATVTPAGGVAPYTYSWNTSPVQTTALASNLGIGTYTVTITDANGCTATNTANIAPPSTPVTTSISNIIPVQCFGSATGAATALPSGGTAPYTFVWNTTPAQSTATANNLAAGNYTVTITDYNGCTATASVNITQPANGVTAAISNVSPVTCYNAADGQATVVASGGATPYSYSWNTTPTQQTATGVSLAAGVWIATVTDANGCTDTQSVTIAEPAPIAASIANLTHVSCNSGSDGTIAALASGGTSPYTWSWNTTPLQTTSSATGLTAGTYILTVTDSSNCSDTVHATITEPAPLTSNVNPQNALCQGSTGSATAVPAGGTPPYSFNWSTTPVQTTATVSNLTAGTYFIATTDANGCVYNDTVTISAPSTAVVATAVLQGQVTCFGGTNGSALAAVTGGSAPYSYIWNTIPSQSTAAATGLSAGTYMVTVTDDNGCFDTAMVSISEPSEIQVSASALNNICAGTANGKAVAVASGGTAPYTYFWSTSPVQTADTAVSLTPGNYTISVTDALGCIKSAVMNLSSYPAPIIDAGPDRTLCEGETLILSATGAQYYTWTGTAALSCTACPAPSSTPTSNAIYTVYGTDANGCSDSDKIFVNVIHRSPVAVGDGKKICEGDTVSLWATGGIDYNWLPAVGLNNSRSANPIASPATTMNYQVVVTQNLCFSDTLNLLVEVLPKPTIALGPDHKGIAGSVHQINSATHNASSIKWTPSAGLNCDDCFSPVATLSNNVTYTATVSNELGCSVSDDVQISVTCDNSAVFLANTFTPNGDGNNDFFYPQGHGLKVIDKFQIYNRWGELVYEMQNMKANESLAGWDGRYQGVEVSPDVFVYTIQATCSNGDKIILKGDVAVLR